MRLFELNDKNIPYNFTTVTQNGFDARFTINSLDYVAKGQAQQGQLQVLFFLKDDESLTQTHTGSPFLVFSTVTNIVRDYLAQNKSISMLSFTVSQKELNRIKLYDKFSSVIGKYIPGAKFINRASFPVHGGIYLYMFTLN